MTSNNGVNVQHEADNRKYFATNNSNVLLKTTLSKSNVNSTFTRLPSNSGIVIDFNTWIGSMGNNKILLYNAIKDINWGIGSPRQMNGNNASFGINNNVSLGGRYKISDYLTEAQFNNTSNLKLFYKSSTEIGVFHGTLANIGIANYGTDQTKHSVNNLRQQSSTALWGTLQNGYLYLNDTFGKVIYFDNNGIGFLNKSLLSNYSGRWIPYLDGGNYLGSGANRLVFGDNTWQSLNGGASNSDYGGINRVNSLQVSTDQSSYTNTMNNTKFWLGGGYGQKNGMDGLVIVGSANQLGYYEPIKNSQYYSMLYIRNYSYHFFPLY